jgi:DNA primase
VLCEGYTDDIALHQAGLQNVVGSMGTALTEHQVGELARLAPQVALALDADAAGQEAMLRVAKVAAGRKLELRVVPLPAGQDPADVVATGGAEAITALVEASVPFVAFRVERAMTGRDLSRPEEKDRVLEELRSVFPLIAPGALRDQLVSRVSHGISYAESRVGIALAQPARESSRPTRENTGVGVGQTRERRGRTSSGPEPRPTAPRLRLSAPDPLDLQERQFLAACIATPADGATFLAAESEQALSTPLNRRAIAHLRSHLEAPAGATDDDPELAAFVAELVNRATHLRSRAILEAEALKLRKARLDRRIADIRAAGSGDIAPLAAEREALLPALNRLVEQAMEAELG